MTNLNLKWIRPSAFTGKVIEKLSIVVFVPLKAHHVLSFGQQSRRLHKQTFFYLTENPDELSETAIV